MHLDKIFDFENNPIAVKNSRNSDFAVAWKSCKIALKEAIENNRPNSAIDGAQNESIEDEFVLSAKNNAFRCYVKLIKLPILQISTVDFLDEIKFNSQTMTLTRTPTHTQQKIKEEIDSTNKLNQKPADTTRKGTKKNKPEEQLKLTKIDEASTNDRKYPKKKGATKLEPAVKKNSVTHIQEEPLKTDQKCPKRKCTAKLEPPAKKRAISKIEEQPPKTVRKYPRRKCTKRLESK